MGIWGITGSFFSIFLTNIFPILKILRSLDFFPHRGLGFEDDFFWIGQTILIFLDKQLGGFVIGTFFCPSKILFPLDSLATELECL